MAGTPRKLCAGAPLWWVTLLLGFAVLYGPQIIRAEEFIRAHLADGFDFPVGKPDSWGYYKARGFQGARHRGEDWNGRGGGDTDLGDPVYSIGNGHVVYSADFGLGWGNVIIIRHAYRDDDGRIRFVDSLYGHLHQRLASVGDDVQRGEKIGTIGNNRGQYPAHLHLEVRKKLQIGMKRSDYPATYAEYWSPTDFIQQHRSLRAEFREVRMPINNFQDPGATLSLRGRSLPIPNLPDTSQARALDNVDTEVRRILEAYELAHAPVAGETDPQSPRVAPPIRRELSEEQAAAEARDRARIRAFWTNMRNESLDSDT